MIPFGGTYTRQQWGRGIRLAMHPKGRALVLRLLAFGLVLAGIGLIVASLVQGQASAPRLLRAAVGVVLFAWWALQPYVRAWRASARPWRARGRAPSLAGTVSGEGIASNASARGSVDKWDTFLRAHVRDELVVLVGADGLATTLPRSFFASDDDWHGFRQFVEFNVVQPR